MKLPKQKIFTISLNQLKLLSKNYFCIVGYCNIDLKPTSPISNFPFHQFYWPASCEVTYVQFCAQSFSFAFYGSFVPKMRQTHKCVRREKACVNLIYRQEPLHAGRQMLWFTRDVYKFGSCLFTASISHYCKGVCFGLSSCADWTVTLKFIVII